MWQSPILKLKSVSYDKNAVRGGGGRGGHVGVTRPSFAQKGNDKDLNMHFWHKPQMVICIYTASD